MAFWLSMVLCSGSVLGCQKVLWKVRQIRLGLPKGSVEGSTKVAPRFHQGSTKVAQVSWCPLLGRQIRFGVPKGSVEGSPITSLNLSRSSSTLLRIFLNSVSFGVFSHSKGLGAKWHVCLLGFFANGFRLPKGSLEWSPFVSQSPADFWSNGCCFWKGSVEGSAN